MSGDRPTFPAAGRGDTGWSLLTSCPVVPAGASAGGCAAVGGSARPTGGGPVSWPAAARRPGCAGSAAAGRSFRLSHDFTLSGGGAARLGCGGGGGRAGLCAATAGSHWPPGGDPDGRGAAPGQGRWGRGGAGRRLLSTHSQLLRQMTAVW